MELSASLQTPGAARRSRLRARPLTTLLGAIVALTSMVLAAPAAVAAERVAPFPDETLLTQAERRLALEGMAPRERAQIGAAFADGARELVVSYTRKRVRIDVLSDGTEVVREVVPSEAAPGSSLSIPNDGVAGSATKEDLYISLTVSKTRSTKPFEWRVWMYSEWRGKDGMHATNSSADAMAAAWSGGAYVHSQVGSGAYINGTLDLCKAPLDEWPDDGAANTATAWKFHEWRPGFFACPMSWGLIDVRIRTDSLAGRTDNIVYRYFHTFGRLSYDFSFSRTPSIGVTPTEEQWSLALFGTYTH